MKAARYLHGREGDRGAAPLPVAELAQREPLRSNGISANRLEEIEQMKAHGRPMELEKVAQALGLRVDWFTAEAITDTVDPVTVQLDRIEETVLGLAGTGKLATATHHGSLAATPPEDEPTGELPPSPRGKLGRIAEGDDPTARDQRRSQSRRAPGTA